MSERSQNIFGRAVRTIKKHDPTFKSTNQKIIYSDMQMGQDDIFSKAQLEGTHTITIKTSTESYPLTEYQRKIIGSIKTLVRPSTWTYKIDIVSNTEWDDIKNATYATTQPVKATIFGNSIHFFPIPTSSYNGDELTAICYMNGSKDVIDKNTDPEVPDIFDRALELFTIAESLSGEMMDYYKNEYEKEVDKKLPLVQKKHHSLRVGRVW